MHVHRGGQQVQHVGSHRRPHPTYVRLPVLGAAALVLVTAIAGVVATNVIGDVPSRNVQVTWAGLPLYAGGNAAIDREVQDFVKDCQNSVNAWRAGQISWPPKMSIDVGDSVTYQAAVDVHTVPLPPAVVLGVKDTASAPVSVRCALSARLVPVDDSVEVVNNDAEGWRPRLFDESGVLQWSWTVKPKALGTHQLRLELKPVAQASKFQFMDEGQTFTRVTPIEVSGSALQRVASAVDETKGTVGVLFGALMAILAAAFAFTKQGNELRAEWAKGQADRRKRKKAEAALVIQLPDDPKDSPPSSPSAPRKGASKKAAPATKTAMKSPARSSTKKSAARGPQSTQGTSATAPTRAAKRSTPRKSTKKATAPAVVDVAEAERKDAQMRP